MHSRTAKKLKICALASALTIGLSGGAALAQANPNVTRPTVSPEVNQLGQMEGLNDPDKATLAFMIFLQVVACVAVAIALAGQLSLPGKKRTPKA